MSPDLDIVIPTWNGRALMERCLEVLLPQLAEGDRVVVVDNGSEDGTAELLSGLPQVQLVALPHNHGFAPAVNRGIAAGDAPWVVLLNNDALVLDGFLSALRDAASTAEPHVGALAAKMLAEDGRHLDSTGDFTWAWAKVFARGRGELDTGQYDARREVFSASGGASAFRRQMLEDTGGFEESFFAYYEDVDLGYRAQWRGWTARFVPEARVSHQMSATSARIPGWRERLSYRNHVRLFVRNTPTRDLLLRWPLFVVVLLRGFYRLTSGAQRVGAAKGVLDALRELPVVLAQRRSLSARRTVTAREMRQRLQTRPGPPR